MPQSTKSTLPRTPIVVLGAGIIGLTTAVRLLESPLCAKIDSRTGQGQGKYDVHIIANHWPDDPLDPKYASSAAGAHHLSFADDEDHRQRRWDRRTFAVMHDEWRKEGEGTGLMVIKQTEYMSEGKHLKIYEEHPDFVESDPSVLPPGIAHSVSFTSVTMTPQVYLRRLLGRIRYLQAQQGTIAPRMHRLHLPSLSAISSPPVLALLGGLTPAVILNCTGIGSLTLGGVSDTLVHPIRGHVVKVRAPWIREGFTRQIGALGGAEGGQRTYVIPRPDGEVILGGTREVGDWNPYPSEESRRDILKRAVEICPALIPAHQRSEGLTEEEEKTGPPRTLRALSVDNAELIRKENGIEKGEGRHPLEELITGEIVGFRPQRHGGIRLEVGERVILDGGKTVQVVHNYGHGGAGWQSCWGCAEDAVGLVQDVLGKGLRAKL